MDIQQLYSSNSSTSRCTHDNIGCSFSSFFYLIFDQLLVPSTIKRLHWPEILVVPEVLGWIGVGVRRCTKSISAVGVGVHWVILLRPAAVFHAHGVAGASIIYNHLVLVLVWFALLGLLLDPRPPVVLYLVVSPPGQLPRDFGPPRAHK